MKRNILLLAPLFITDGGGGGGSSAPEVTGAEAPETADEAPNKKAQRKIERLTSENAELQTQLRELGDKITALEASPETSNLRGQIGELKTILEKAAQENDELREAVAKVESEKEKMAEEERLITEKTSKGVTREQAIAVIRRQKDHDNAMEAQWAKRRSDVIAVLKTVSNPREQRKQLNELYPGIVTVEEINAAKESLAKGATK